MVEHGVVFPVDYVRQTTKIANPLAAAVSPFNGGIDVALAAGAANGCACGELRPSDVTSWGVVEWLQNHGEWNLAAIVYVLIHRHLVHGDPHKCWTGVAAVNNADVGQGGRHQLIAQRKRVECLFAA